MSLRKYHAAFSVDTRIDNRLDGTYTVEGYTLRPCVLTTENQQSNLSKLVLEFDFCGLEEKGIVNSSERNKRRWDNNKRAEIAKTFVAWLVLATREWARLSSQSNGQMMRFSPSTHHPIKDFNESILETTFHIDKKAEKGEFLEVQRPSFSFSSKKPLSTFKLPSDFPTLTKKCFL